MHQEWIYDFFVHLLIQVFYYSHQTSGGHDLQHNGKSVTRDEKYLTNVHAEEAVRFITDRDKEKPFFLIKHLDQQLTLKNGIMSTNHQRVDLLALFSYCFFVLLDVFCNL